MKWQINFKKRQNGTEVKNQKSLIYWSNDMEMVLFMFVKEGRIILRIKHQCLLIYYEANELTKFDIHPPHRPSCGGYLTSSYWRESDVEREG